MKDTILLEGMVNVVVNRLSVAGPKKDNVASAAVVTETDCVLPL